MAETHSFECAPEDMRLPCEFAFDRLIQELHDFLEGDEHGDMPVRDKIDVLRFVAKELECRL